LVGVYAFSVCLYMVKAVGGTTHCRWLVLGDSVASVVASAAVYTSLPRLKRMRL
jgi:hypothetical protein